MKLESGFVEALYALHEQLLAGDPTILADIAQLVHSTLSRAIRAQFPTNQYPRVDDHMILEGSADALLEYGRAPWQARASTGAGVFGFLALRAKSRVLNQMRKTKTRELAEGRYVLGLGPKKGKSDNVVAHRRAAGEYQETRDENALVDPNPADSDDGREGAALREEVLASVSNALDRRILNMMLDGERKTGAFATVLGISDLPLEEQRAIVKQHKDRIRTAAKREQKKKRSGPKKRGRPRGTGGTHG